MRKLCKHDAYLTGMKHRKYGKTTQHKYHLNIIKLTCIKYKLCKKILIVKTSKLCKHDAYLTGMKHRE